MKVKGQNLLFDLVMIVVVTAIIAITLLYFNHAADERLVEAPGATTESYGEFQPSDSPPRCLPSGTVTYESFDEAANMRYWVFRWPDGRYQAVPRLRALPGGRVVAYEPDTTTLTVGGSADE